MRADSILIASRREPSVILASFGANLLSLAVPMAMIHIYDRVIPHQGFATLTVLGIAIFVAILAEIGLRSARRRILERAAERFELGAYPAALQALMASDPAIEDRRSQGEIYRSVMAIDRLRGAHVGETSMALLDLPFAFLFLTIIGLISPAAGLCVFLILSVSFLILRTARARVLAMQIKRKENETRRHSFLSETLRGLDVVKGMRIENFMLRRYERLLGSSASISSNTARSVQLAQGFTAAVGTLSPLIIGSVGAFMVIQGEMTVGSLAAIVLLTGRIIQPIMRVEAFLAGMENIRQDRRDLEDILSTAPRRDGPLRFNKIETFEVSGVSTGPAPGSGIAFENVNLSLQIGDCLAINGADKITLSTFLKLLAGELPISKGQVKANGRCIFQYRAQDRHALIRYFSPDHSLIEGTLLENMTAFRPRLYRDRAVELAQKVGIERSISQSPDGFSLRVGPGAKSLLPKSLTDAALIVGGLVTNPGLVLFDEANAALDREIDQNLLNTLEADRFNRITVMVSSRPSYLKTATCELDISKFVSGEVGRQPSRSFDIPAGPK